MKSIEEMNYVEFISLLRETNRCPGGKETIRWILQQSRVDASAQVLEIGSNTGFTSLEVARTAKCSVIGIDPVPEAVATAQQELADDAPFVQERVTFQVGSAYDIDCDNESIDLIFAGGSTSFMDDKDRAIAEMHRVLKPWGMLSATNLYYHTPPPQTVLDAVSATIGVTINPSTADDWKNVYLQAGEFELYAFETAELQPRTPAELDTYVDYFLSKPHIQAMSAADRDAIKLRWRQTLEVFNENHRYLGYIKAMLRKRTIAEEPELFLTKPAR